MYKLINGWTKEMVMAQIRKYNNNSRAMSDDGTACTYQSSDGNKCAVGCFIPDGHPALKSRDSAKHIAIYYPELASCMPFKGWDLMEFQSCHDKSEENGRSVYGNLQDFLDTLVE